MKSKITNSRVVHPPSVMVVDDDVDMINLLTRYLESVGVRVIAVTSGSDCLNVARRERIDLMLMDLTMPGLDGFAICRALKTDPACADIPVVVVSVSDDDEVRSQVERLGAADFLAKPVFRRELITTIGRYLRTSNARVSSLQASTTSHFAI